MSNKKEQLKELEKEIEKEKEIAIINPELEKEIINQIENEYQSAFKYTQTKRTEQLKRLKLYNNQGRQKDKVGDPLLFVVFQTLLASLYDSKMTVKWEAFEEGDIETEENLNAVAEYDYNLMQKDIIDYEWIWDTLFFGRGLLMLHEFDRKKMCPVPEVINPMTFIRDPDATSINGNMQGFGGCRFFGREILLSTEEMEKNKAYINFDNLLKAGKTGMIDEDKQIRDDAQGRQNDKNILSTNYQNELLEWFTIYKGEKYIITLANKRKKIVRFQKLKQDKWPVIDRCIFPISHDWDGVNIPDLIEDKQRARAILLNLSLESAKSDVYPMYLFDKNKISNPNDLDFDFNKFIPTKDLDGNTLQPFPKSKFGGEVNYIFSLLDISAQKSVAAPEISQGIQPTQDRTFGETKLVAEGANARHSLALKIFGWSDKNFYRQWYSLYKLNLKDDFDEKVIRLQGLLSPVWRKLTKENLIATIDPDVLIQSSFIIEQKKQKELANFSSFIQIAFQDQDVNRKYALRKLAKLNGMDKVERDLLFPPTIDEIKAEQENELLNENEFVEVNIMDDHKIHREIHMKANQNKASIAHIEAHKFIEMKAKENPEIFGENINKSLNKTEMLPVSEKILNNL